MHDGSGDDLDILANGRQFVAFGIHPKTKQPYAWIGPESPLTASPKVLLVYRNPELGEPTTWFELAKWCQPHDDDVFDGGVA